MNYLRICAPLLVFVVIGLFFPIGPKAEAFGPSFGGRIAIIIPCINGGIWTSIIPAIGSAPGPFVWTPGTITRMAGPPKIIGGGILGLYAPSAYPCYWAPCSGCFLLGAPMILVGTSAGPAPAGGLWTLGRLVQTSSQTPGNPLPK